MMDVHESSLQPTTDLSKKHRRRLIYLTIGIVLWYAIFTAFAIAFDGGDSFINGKEPGMYWLAFYPSKILLIAIIPPTIAIATALLIPNILATRYGVFSLIGINLILLVPLCLIAVGQVFEEYEYNHIQTVRHGGHTYYLADRIPNENMVMLFHDCRPRSTDPACIEAKFVHEYLVYRCGWLGIVCHEIAAETFDKRVWRSNGELSVNAVGSIVLEVDGVETWTYPTDEQ